MPDMEKVITTLQYRINEARNKGEKVTTIFVSTLSNAMMLLKDQPQIIRCKDCKHRPELKLYSDRHGNYTAVEFPDGSKCPCQCEDFFYSWYPKDDWFCANGERRSE